MLCQQIKDRYGFKEVALELIRDGQGGAAIFKAIVDDEQLALRVSGPFLSKRPDWIEFEGKFLEEAHKGGISVASARRGIDGQFGQPVQDGTAFLTEWALGNVEWPTPIHKAHRLGQAVAQLHCATEDIRWEADVRSFATIGLLERPITLLDEVADASPLRPYVEEMSRRIDSIIHTSSTFGAVHGDIHQGNCHFNESEATLFDFAQCGIGWRAFDLAGFLWPWRDKSILNPALRCACDAYLTGYESVRTLTDEERYALPAFIRARDLWEAGEWIATGNARQKPDEVRAGILSWTKSWSNRPLGQMTPFLEN